MLAQDGAIAARRLPHRSVGRSRTTLPSLIDGASFAPPGALKAISEAFDAAWAEIAEKFGKDPTEIELARHRLANAVLAVASEDSRDLEALKKAALQRMALDYRKV